MQNKYPGTCAVCGVAVPAMEGHLSEPDGSSRKRWVIKCLPCSGKPKDEAVFIEISRSPTGLIAFKPSAFLGQDLFATYRNAISKGAKYDGNSAHVAKVDEALGCIAALESNGFTLRIHPEVSASLQAFSAKVKNAVGKANDRADVIEAVLREQGLALFPFQRIGVEFLATHRHALLMDDMGLGKTIQALIAIPKEAPVLVAGPVAALSVWADEVAKWRPDLTFRVIESKAKFYWPKGGEMVFVTYGNLPDAEKRSTPADGTVLIADEAHTLKSGKTVRSKRFRIFSQLIHSVAGHVWLLTATPLQNHPVELWNILQAAGLAREVFTSYDHFQSLYNCYPARWGGTVWGMPSPEVPELLRKVALRREKKDVLTELPEKIRCCVRVSLGSDWNETLNNALEHLHASAPSIWDWVKAGPEVYEEGGPTPSYKRGVSAGSVIEAREKLLSMKNRAQDFRHMAEARQLLAKAKIPALLEIVESFEEQEEPVIVFSDHRAPIDALASRKGWAVITGETNPADRHRIAGDFQAGQYKGIGLTIDAGAVSITLTRASNMIFVDRSYNPALNDQAEDRAVRIGQTRGVVIQQLVADHRLDIRLQQILDQKQKIITGSVEAATIDPTERPAWAAPPEQPEVDFERLETEAKQKTEEAAHALEEARKLADQRAQENTRRVQVAEEDQELEIPIEIPF